MKQGVERVDYPDGLRRRIKCSWEGQGLDTDQTELRTAEKRLLYFSLLLQEFAFLD